MSGVAPGTTIGPYRLDSLIGSGPVGDVYRASNMTQPGSDVALKVLRPLFSTNQIIRDRFLSMQRRMTQFDHPHILPSEYIGEQGELVFAVTPFVPQGSLLTRILRSRLAPRDIAPLFRQICDMLIALHAQGIIHGNLKPSNVLLYENRHALIGDIGQIWRLNEVNLATNSISPQTVAYMAPEQAYGSQDMRADIYSLGCILYHALTGNVPFMGTSAQDVLNRHQRQSAIALIQVQPPLGANALAFDDIFRKTLAKDPRARYPSMVDFQKALIEAGQQANEMPSRMMPGVRPGMPLQQQPPYMPPPQPQGPPAHGMPMPYQYPQAGPPSRPVMPPQHQIPVQPPVPSPRSQPVAKDQREIADFYTARYTTPSPFDQPSEEASAQEMTGQSPVNRSPYDDTESQEYQEYSAEYSEMHVRTRFDADDDSSREMKAGRSSREADRDDQMDWLDDQHEDDYSREMSQYYPSAHPQAGSNQGPNNAQSRYPRDSRGAYEDDDRQWYEDHRRQDARSYDDRLERAGVSRPRTNDRRRLPDDSMLMSGIGSSADQRYSPVSKGQEKPRKKGNRLPSILSFIALLVLSINGLLIVTFAPKLCPNHMCDSLHNTIIKYLPIKSSNNSIPGLPVTPTVPTTPITPTSKAQIFIIRDMI